MTADATPDPDNVADGADDMLKPYLDAVGRVADVRQWAAGLSTGARLDIAEALFATAPDGWSGTALSYLADKYGPNPFAKLMKLGEQAKQARRK